VRRKKPPGSGGFRWNGSEGLFRGGLDFGLDGGFSALEVCQTAFAFDRLVGLFSHISLYFAFMIRFCVDTMVIRMFRFNIYLSLLLTLSALTGCQSPEAKREKQIATLRVHLEAKTDMMGRTEPVSICRSTPIVVHVVSEPFLNETHVESARIIEGLGGFALMIQFNSQGRMLLEQYSATNPNRRVAIRSQFGIEPDVVDRWLAAPRMSRRIQDGVLSFTPDADREEAGKIARGLNNIAGNAKQEKKSGDSPGVGGVK
jgi:hypothetical protein